MNPCPVCGIVWGQRQRCESQTCPCFGTVPGSAESDAAAVAWRARPQRRTLSGADALAALERRAWLELAAVAVPYAIEHEAG